ncbi:MAG: exo-alpha-sialidase [Pirellulaceae bacterium]|nr:exo-alpha-sialidase [Pirellulaceae bacterium]
MDSHQRQSLATLASRLIDQSAAKIIVPPQRPGSGHWFGGGNMVQDPAGTLWLVGRYRNQGDSRTGLGKGERGLELAIFRSDDRGNSFTKTISFSKSDLNIGNRQVLSIEGTALRLSNGRVELYLSTEKSGIDYPDGLESFLKPGTGVWTIDRIIAKDFASLSSSTIQPLVSTNDPRFVQVKDPFVFDNGRQGWLLFCTHPFCWSSSNTGYVAIRDDGSIDTDPCFDFFPRGFTWDVAITRGTSVMPIPKIGPFADTDLSLLFYDGGECVRNLDEHDSAVKRPRGYSCEELGGLAVVASDDLHRIERLSENRPMFVSPHGTGCSRYVDVLVTDEGYYATWQQSQADHSQPLVMNFLSTDAVNQILCG